MSGTTTTDETLKNVLDELEDVEKKQTGQWMARCPAHNDNRASLSVAVGEDYPVVLNCFAGCSFKEVAGELDALSTQWKPWEGTEVARYTYRDEDGNPLYDVVRYEMRDEEHPAYGQKQFAQQAYLPDHENAGKNGCPEGYVWGRKKHGIEPVLYRLQKVKSVAEAGRVVFLVEGEEDVHTMEDLGFVATTNPQGAGKWRTSFTKTLAGARVVILTDNDPPGKKHGRNVAQALLGKAESVRVVDLPGLPEKGDVTDWVEDGGTPEELKELVNETPIFEPNGNGQAVDDGEGQQHEFWFFDSDTKKYKVDRAELIRFLESRGVGKLYAESDLDSLLVRVEDSIVRRTSRERIKDFALNYVRGTELDNGPQITDALLRGANVYFSDALFEFLSPLGLDFHRDTAERAFFYYENGFVEVTSEGFSLRPYSELDGVIWEDQVIDRKFKDLTATADYEDWDWHRHLWNVSGQETARHNSLCTAIGYLLHGYKDPAVTKAVIFMDEKDSEVEEGRTGKSLTAEALQHLCSTLRIDGRNFSFDGQFAFQQVTLETEVIDFNDCRKRFPFERLFSLITDDFPIEQKRQDRVTIPFEESPKFILSTNYVIEGRGASFDDRTFQVEFSDHYGVDHTPRDEFGHRLFDDWGAAEWAQFDNVMLACVRQYLRDGLTEYEHVNIDFRRLKQHTCPDFAAWAVDFVEPGNEYEKDALWRTFRDAYAPDYEDLSKRRFGYWLSDFARVYDLEKEVSRPRRGDKRIPHVTFRSLD